jgi:putative transposase
VAKILRRVRQAGVYFVTSRTWQSRTIFSNAEPARILLEQIADCRERGFYKLHAFVIMPDHFHALLTPGEGTSLEKAMQMIKGGSAHRIREELHFVWPIWQRGFHDRWMRDATELQARREYIETNPVAAGLAVRAEEYSFSSASGKVALDPSRFDDGSLSG